VSPTAAGGPPPEPPRPAAALGAEAVPAVSAPRPAAGAGAPAVPAAGVLDGDALLAKAARENFPVAPRWLPRALREDLLAIYGFARLADDAGDEAPGDRSALLDALEADLLRAAAGGARHPLVRRLGPALAAGRLPLAPFRRLLEANRRDQRVARYARWAELADYCTLSAAPVGELVLHALGAATPARLALCADVCTALQLLEHCQDAAEDHARGRVYLPAEDLARFAACEADLARRPAPAPLRAVLAFEVERARALLAAAAPLAASLRGRARWLVAGFAAGGLAAADALARAGFDPSAGAPLPRRRDLLRHAVVLACGRVPRQRAALARGPA
jgi:squalene synthase HpnC